MTAVAARVLVLDRDPSKAHRSWCTPIESAASGRTRVELPGKRICIWSRPVARAWVCELRGSGGVCVGTSAQQQGSGVGTRRGLTMSTVMRRKG